MRCLGTRAMRGWDLESVQNKAKFTMGEMRGPGGLSTGLCYLPSNQATFRAPGTVPRRRGRPDKSFWSHGIGPEVRAAGPSQYRVA